MELNQSILIRVADPSGAGQARRRAVLEAERLGFSEAQAGNLAIVVTESATNIVRHAREGSIVLGAVADGSGPGLEMLALDKGSGITDVGRAIGDGHSSAGSQGTGLGAIRRLSQGFDLYSVPGQGTALLARLWSTNGRSARPASIATSRFRTAAVCISKPGEEMCGDAWTIHRSGGRTFLLVVDGLGHGPDAQQAASAAVETFRHSPERAPAEQIEFLHDALRSTRGAAATVTLVDRGSGVIRHAGVGNIAGRVLSGDRSTSLVSHNGTLGYRQVRIREFSYPWAPDCLLVLHSDGLATHWNLDAYAGLRARDHALIAGVLYRDFARGRDDVTVLVGGESG